MMLTVSADPVGALALMTYASGTFHGMEHGWAGWTAEDRELTQQTPDLTGASPAEPALERFWRSPSRSSPPWLHLDAPGSLKKYSFLDSIPGGLIQVVWGKALASLLKIRKSCEAAVQPRMETPNIVQTFHFTDKKTKAPKGNVRCPDFHR